MIGMEDEWVHEVLFQLNWVWKEPWDNEEPEPAERDLPDPLLIRWFSLNLKWFCRRSRQWCWMLTGCLRLWTEDLTNEGDDPEHDLVEPNLMHSNDFDGSEEVLCDDVAEECTFLSREDELEVDCDELHPDQWWGSWHFRQWGSWHETMTLPCDERDMLDAQGLWYDHHWHSWGSLTSLWWGYEEQMIEERLMQLLLYLWVLLKVLDTLEAVMDQCHRWDCWCWPPWCSLLWHLMWSDWFEVDDHWILDLGQRQRLRTPLMMKMVVSNMVNYEVAADEEVWDPENLWADLLAWQRRNDPQAELRYCTPVFDDLSWSLKN